MLGDCAKTLQVCGFSGSDSLLLMIGQIQAYTAAILWVLLHCMCPALSVQVARVLGRMKSFNPAVIQKLAEKSGGTGLVAR